MRIVSLAPEVGCDETEEGRHRGRHRRQGQGREGVVERVLPNEDKSSSTASTRREARQGAQRHDKAGIIDREMPIDARNVMFVTRASRLALDTGSTDGTKIRVARPSGDVIG